MNSPTIKDSIYAQPRTKVRDFVFDQKVANVFDDMIQRSVPGYGSIISMIGCLAQQYTKPNTVCYDLGCSTGKVTLTIRQRIQQPGCRIVAVDNSKAMVKRCQANVVQNSSKVPVDVVCSDIRDVLIEQASIVVLNFTLQFIEPNQREELLQRIYDGMVFGGVLIISDKIAFDNLEEQKFQTELHHTFKKLNGYSDLEIAQKRTALEKILIPDTLPKHQERLRSVGFCNVFPWFKCFNFASMVAFK